MPGRVLKENNSPLNRAALKWLREAREPVAPAYLHLLSLAMWGLENEASGEWPQRETGALENQVHALLGWEPKTALEWLLTNPEGPDRDEQEQNLLRDLQKAKKPKPA